MLGVRFELFRASQANALAQLGGGLWGWRLVDREGRRLAHGIGYPSREACRGAVEILRRTTIATPIADTESLFENWASRDRARAGGA